MHAVYALDEEQTTGPRLAIDGWPRRHKRILIHDYSGHPFQVQLSRELARRGHEVLHLYSTAFQTPKGALSRQPDDPATFRVEGLRLKEPFAKYSFIKRRRQEIEYGKLAAERTRRFRPDVVIASNLPLDPLHHTWLACADTGASLVVWLQDLYSVAMRKILPRKLPMLGDFVARHYEAIERRVLRGADRIVCITDDFLPHLGSWGVAGRSVRSSRTGRRSTRSCRTQSERMG